MHSTVLALFATLSCVVAAPAPLDLAAVGGDAKTLARLAELIERDGIYDPNDPTANLNINSVIPGCDWAHDPSNPANKGTTKFGFSVGAKVGGDQCSKGHNKAHCWYVLQSLVRPWLYADGVITRTEYYLAQASTVYNKWLQGGMLMVSENPSNHEQDTDQVAA